MEFCLKTLITGAAGFIGMNCALRLLDRADEVIGIDNLNDYYDPTLKEARLQRHLFHNNFTQINIDIEADWISAEYFCKKYEYFNL